MTTKRIEIGGGLFISLHTSEIGHVTTEIQEANQGQSVTVTTSELYTMYKITFTHGLEKAGFKKQADGSWLCVIGGKAHRATEQQINECMGKGVLPLGF